eukprot:scaffold191900_cov27-Attheya_sp.AAC.2
MFLRSLPPSVKNILSALRWILNFSRFSAAASQMRLQEEVSKLDPILFNPNAIFSQSFRISLERLSGLKSALNVYKWKIVSPTEKSKATPGAMSENATVAGAMP